MYQTVIQKHSDLSPTLGATSVRSTEVGQNQDLKEKRN
jgi:hypothetical protein